MAHRANILAAAHGAAARDDATRAPRFSDLLAAPFSAMGDVLSALIVSNGRSNPPR
jgi:hypothetical protein